MPDAKKKTKQPVKTNQARLNNRWIRSMVDLVAIENGMARQAVAPLTSAKSRIIEYLSSLDAPVQDLNDRALRLVVGRAWRAAWNKAAAVTRDNVQSLAPRWALRQASIIFQSAKPAAVRGLRDHIQRTLFKRKFKLKEAAVAKGLTIRAQDVMGDAFRAIGDFEVGRYLESAQGNAYLAAFDRAWRVNGADADRVIRESISSGTSLDELTAQFDSVAGHATTSVERLVRTQTQALAFDTEEMVAEYAGPLLSSVQWVAILDGRMCLRCGRLHGQVFDIVDPLRPSIPLHPMCRCSLVPLLNAEAGGFEGEEMDIVDLPAEVTFDTWFGAQSDELQISIVGPTRHALYKAGFPLEKFVNRLGRIIKIASLPTVSEWLASK